MGKDLKVCPGEEYAKLLGFFLSLWVYPSYIHVAEGATNSKPMLTPKSHSVYTY